MGICQLNYQNSKSKQNITLPLPSPICQTQKSKVLNFHTKYIDDLPTKNEFDETQQIQRYVQYDTNITYQGSYKNNKRNGFGKMIWQDNTQYEGWWKDDQIHGNGIFQTKDCIINGQWKNNQLNGFTQYQMSKYIYEGYILDNKKQGLGKEIYKDQSQYIGYFENDVKSGIGQYDWPNYTQYQGSFKNDLINGYGRIQWYNGNKYEGEFENNYLHGKGCFEWKDNRKYEGEYYYDAKQGYGIYYWENNQKYQGMWKNGKWDGEGELIKNNIIIKGQWKQGIQIL